MESEPDRSHRDKESEFLKELDPPILHSPSCRESHKDFRRMRKLLHEDSESLNRPQRHDDSDPGYFTLPLQAAAKAGHIRCIHFLLHKGARLDAPDEDGNTALQKAIYFDQPETVTFLLDRGANPISLAHNPYFANRTYYLCVACYFGSNDILELLLKRGGILTEDAPSMCDSGGSFYDTPTAEAVSEGGMECFKLLFLYGAAMDLRKLPIFATRTNRPHVVADHSLSHLLFQKGSRYDDVERRFKMLDMMHEFGVDFWQKDRHGRTAVEEAQSYGFDKYNPEYMGLTQRMKEYMGIPLSLQSLSRLAIRKSMASNYLNNIEHLPLPMAIIHFLSFPDV